ncbi:hypothetical protein MKX01_010042 [Papaver californicum]|nr:hypothetical protein MKX01_010042 [Papaver californicum]
MDKYLSDNQVIAYVRDALLSVARGDADNYDQLVGIMNHSEYLSDDEVAMLVHVDQHEKLLQSIFGMNMWKYRPDVLDALMDFITRLATSDAKYFDSSLQTLVSNFLPPNSAVKFLNLPCGLAKKKQVLHRVNSTLENITKLMPLAPLRLCPIIRQRMPHISANEALMAIYVENMLRLESSTIGELVGSEMLSAVVYRLIELDVEIGWDDILQPESSKGIFDVGDGFRLVKEVTSIAEKLDSLMVLTCQHLKSCAENDRLSEVFQTLLESFRFTVLNTYKSKFAQFVMFYTCSLDPGECGVELATRLLNVFTCNSTVNPLITRMSAVSYLASYLSRGKFLEMPIIVDTLSSLLDWCLDYCRLIDAGEKTLNPEAHGLFYSGCQATMYVLCFRMTEMLDDPQIYQFPLQLIFEQSLNPLKVCLPSIVEEFLRQARAASLYMAPDKFVSNNLLESDFSKAYGGMERLDMFFPFDPCLLKKCSETFIKPNYLFWSDVVPPYGDEEDFSAEEQIGD